MFKSTLATFLVALSYSMTLAQTDIDVIVNEIIANNTELNSTRMQTSAEKAALASSNNLEDPDVEFSHQWGQKGIGNKWGIDVSQSFDWPGVYSARSKANAATSLAMDYLNDAKAFDVRYNVRIALMDVIYARQKIDLFNQMVSRLDSMTAVYSRGAETGDVSRLDVNKLKIARINANRRLNEASIEYMTAIGTLKGLNGGKDVSGLVDRLDRFPNTALLPQATYENDALSNNPSVKYAAAMDQAELLNEKVLKRSRLPGLTIGYNHEYEMGDHFNGFKIGLTLPFFSNKHKAAEISSRRVALQAERNNVEIASLAEIRSIYGQIERLDNEMTQYRDVLSDGENMRLLNVALAAQHITLIDYLTEYNYFLDAQMSFIDIRYQRELLMAKLTRYSAL